MPMAVYDLILYWFMIDFNRAQSPETSYQCVELQNSSVKQTKIQELEAKIIFNVIRKFLGIYNDCIQNFSGSKIKIIRIETTFSVWFLTWELEAGSW